MKEDLYHIVLSDNENSIVIRCLNDKKLNSWKMVNLQMPLMNCSSSFALYQKRNSK